MSTLPLVGGLVRGRAVDAKRADPFCDRVERLGRRLAQAGGRRVTGYGVDGHATRPNAPESVKPGHDIGVTGVVDIMSLPRAREEEGLDDDMTTKRGEDLGAV